MDNILGFSGCMVHVLVLNSAIVAQKQPTTKTYMNGHDCFPVKSYFQKQESCWIWPVDCSLPTC